MPTDRQRQIEFNEALAVAITQWQGVEIEMFRIFAWCIDSPNRFVASAAFHSVVNFNARLSMTDAVAQIALHGDLELATWIKLRNRAQKRSKRRNELVHFMTFHDATGERMRFRLVPNIFDVNSAGTKEYETADIQRFGSDFGRLANDMHEFANSLFRRRQAKAENIAEGGPST